MKGLSMIARDPESLVSNVHIIQDFGRDSYKGLDVSLISRL